MKVKELIEILKSCDEDALVILSSDAEGNSYSEASDIGSYYFDEENTEIFDLKDYEEEALQEMKKCVTIWP